MANLLSQNAVSVTSGAASLTLTAAQAPTGSMIVVCYTHATVLPGSTSLPGFTLLDQAQSSSSSVLLNDATYFRIATADGITITTAETDANIKFLECFVITGHDGLAPLFSHGGSGNTTTSGNPTAASLNADKANDILLGFASTNAAKTTSINGMTPTNGTGPSDRGAYRSVRYSQVYTSPGATGTKTLTVTSPTSPQRANIMLVLVGDPGQVNVSANDSFTNTDSATISATTLYTDNLTATDSSQLLATSTLSDTETYTDTASVLAQTTLNDSAIATDQVSILQGMFFTLAESETATDIATIAASLAINDSALHTDTTSINVFSTSSDTALHSDIASINTNATDIGQITDSTTAFASATISDLDTATDTATTNVTLNLTDSATHTDLINASISTSASDSGTHTDSVTINIIVADNQVATDMISGRSRINATDQIIATDIARVKINSMIRDDQIRYQFDTQVNPAKPFRVIAQNIFTGEFFHWNVPVVKPELTHRYTAPNSFKAELHGDIRYLTDVSSKFIEDATWLHCEIDGVIRQSTILMPFIDSNGEQIRQIEGIGFSDIPNRRFYLGVPISLVQVDPMSVIRYIWGYCLVGQGIQDFIDIRIPANVNTPVRIGTPLKNVNFQTSAGQNVSFQAGPYDLNAWEVTNLGTELNKLHKETPLEYNEQCGWNKDHTDVFHTINYGYPRIGAARNQTYFRDSENIIEVVPEYVSTRYPRSVTVIGAGEGINAVRATCAFVSGDVKRVPYDLVLENEEIQSFQRAFDIAKFELLRLYRSRYSIKSITIDTTHPNAKLGTFAEGDDIPVQAFIRNVGRVSDWHRIVEYTYFPETKRANLEIEPSSSFGYGANLEVER